MITQEKFENIMEMLISKGPQVDRQFVLYTGSDGADEFAFALEKKNNRDLLEFLFSKGEFTADQAQQLTKMIDSKDRENYEVVKGILEYKCKNHGGNIHNSKSQV